MGMNRIKKATKALKWTWTAARETKKIGLEAARQSADLLKDGLVNAVKMAEKAERDSKQYLENTRKERAERELIKRKEILELGLDPDEILRRR